ncbi:Myb-like_DNA-binding domain-containing protein [Hexamita inflata]|uniref:Myb-like DNA-binding domain-containing protein n=1 Tax=Hexamita inflata TaxID=28002 RepID=A0AA86PNF2_9EUKA|nr:Myb-like DNA-binding domain-containing protein [Hexamita inflata]
MKKDKTRIYQSWSREEKEKLKSMVSKQQGVSTNWELICSNFKGRTLNQVKSMYNAVMRQAGKEKHRYEWDPKEVYFLFNTVFNMGKQWVQISKLKPFSHLDADQLRLKFHFTKKLIEQDSKLRFQVMEVLKYRKQLIKSRHKDLEPVVPVEIHISNLKNIAVMEIIENEEAFINQMLPVLSKLMQNQ